MPRLTLLLPATARFAGIALPATLTKALGRADRSTCEAGDEAQLARHFDVVPRGWPAASLTRVLDSGIDDVRLSGWLRADPAYIRPDINGARLLAIGDALGINQADVDAFLPALRPLFGDAGFTLDAPIPGRWYLRLPREAKLPAFAAPDDVLGDDVFEHIPDALEARRWRVLASEAQVVLHNHPRNAERLAAGRAPVNSLWFWGGGVLPDHARAAQPTVYSDDLRLHGLARIGDFTAMSLAATNPQLASGALVDLRHARDLHGVLLHYLQPASAALATGDTVFDFADGTMFTLRNGDRWRFWHRPLAALAE